MATAIDTSWSSNLSKPASTLKPGEVDEKTLGNPADLGGYRGMQELRGQKYDNRADAAYDWGIGARDKLGSLGDQVTQQALDTSRMASDWAKSDRGFWEGTYKPAMQQQMDFAREYTTPGRMAANRAGAMSGVSVAHDAAADMAKRNLSSFGIDPSSGRYAGLDAGLAAKRAAAGAAAGTKSDRDTEMLGQEYLDRAIRTGATLPGQAANEAGLSLAGGTAAANTGIAVGQAQRGLTEPSGWVGAGDKALQEWKNSLLQQTELGMQQNRDVEASKAAAAKKEEGGSSGIGSLIGMGAGILGSMYGGPIGGMVGSKLGSMAGGAISGGGGGGSGSLFKRGGAVKRYQEGGMVLDEQGLPDYIRPWNPEDDDYDYAQARAAGMGPNEEGHWESREPGSGLQLKGRKHPTFDTAVEEDRQKGYGLEMRNGRYYTVPFKHQAGGPVYDSDDTGGGPLFNVDGRIETVGSVIGEGLGQRQIARNDPQVGTGEEQTRGYHLAPTRGRRNYYVPDEEAYPAYQSQDKMRARELPNADAWAGSYAEGGEIEDEEILPLEEPLPDEGGDQVVTPEMSPSGGAETDDVHALLNEGEFVIPKEVVRWHGEKFFQKLIHKAHDEIAQPQEAEPEQGPPTAMAIAPPTFRSGGTMGA